MIIHPIAQVDVEGPRAITREQSGKPIAFAATTAYAVEVGQRKNDVASGSD
jgi:hypothetical protein